MARSEFRWNKKRKHYAYIFKDVGDRWKNILLHSDPFKIEGLSQEKIKEIHRKYIKLYRHPNKNKPTEETFYVENRIYCDEKVCFDEHVYPWNWDINDKRKIKRIKKGCKPR